MNREVARRRPAQVLSVGPIPPAVVRRAGDIVGATRSEALARLARLQRQGRVESAEPLRLIAEGSHAGKYAVRVVLLPSPTRRRKMRTGTKVAIAAAGITAVVTPIAWTILTLSPAALLVACVAILAGLCALASRGRRRTSVTVTTRVEVR